MPWLGMGSERLVRLSPFGPVIDERGDLQYVLFASAESLFVWYDLIHQIRATLLVSSVNGPMRN